MLISTIWLCFAQYLFFYHEIDQFVLLGLFVIVFISGLFIDTLQTNVLIACTTLTVIIFFVIAKFSQPFEEVVDGNSLRVIFFQTFFLVLAALAGKVMAKELERTVDQSVKLTHKAHAIFEQSTDAIFITNLNFQITELNPQAVELLNIPQEEAIGKNLLDFVPPKSDRNVKELVNDILSEGGISKIEMVFKTKEGADQHIQISSNLVFGEQQQPDHIQVILRDITGRKQAENLVQRLAMQDHLTKVDNRLSLQYRLSSLVAKMNRVGEKFALVYLDLDNFKSVNDKYGHTIGDQLLIAFTKRLNGAIRKGDFLAWLAAMNLC